MKLFHGQFLFRGGRSWLNVVKSGLSVVWHANLRGLKLDRGKISSVRKRDLGQNMQQSIKINSVLADTLLGWTN